MRFQKMLGRFLVMFCMMICFTFSANRNCRHRISSYCKKNIREVLSV